MMYKKLKASFLMMCTKCGAQFTDEAEFTAHAAKCGMSTGLAHRPQEAKSTLDIVAHKAGFPMIKASSTVDGFAAYDDIARPAAEVAQETPVAQLSLLPSIQEHTDTAESPRKPGRPKKQGA
jgi:predicted  nucleic acid-binding Zn-ribbon protein